MDADPPLHICQPEGAVFPPYATIVPVGNCASVPEGPVGFVGPVPPGGPVGSSRSWGPVDELPRMALWGPVGPVGAQGIVDPGPVGPVGSCGALLPHDL